MNYETKADIVLNDFIIYLNKNRIIPLIINESNTNVDMILSTFLLLRYEYTLYKYILPKLVKYIKYYSTFTNNDNIIVCEYCGRGFNSRQALGGHFSSHSHKRKREEAREEKREEKRELYLRSNSNKKYFKVDDDDDLNINSWNQKWLTNN